MTHVSPVPGQDDPPADKRHLGTLSSAVLPLLKQSARGQLWSYTAIAEEAGFTAEDAVHVGWILHYSDEAYDAPWWRVIEIDGAIRVSKDPNLAKRAEIQVGLLRQEGHTVVNNRVVPSRPGQRFADAVAWAAELHGSQDRKGTTIPYLTHLLAVASIVLETGGDEDDAIAGLLHDAIEDTPATKAIIERRFGRRVASIVVGCTDAFEQPKPPWRERKQLYLDHLTQSTTPLDVVRVAAADKLHNARSILADLRATGGECWARFNAPVEDQLWYYTTVADIVSRRLPGPLATELNRTVSALNAEAG